MSPEAIAEQFQEYTKQIASLTATCTAQQGHINDLYQRIEYLNLSLTTAYQSITDLHQKVSAAG